MNFLQPYLYKNGSTFDDNNTKFGLNKVKSTYLIEINLKSYFKTFLENILYLQIISKIRSNKTLNIIKKSIKSGFLPWTLFIYLDRI